MISIAEVRDLARARLRSKLGAWVATPPEAPVLVMSLKPPIERDVLLDEAAAERWAREWGALTLPSDVEVEWQVRSWRAIGRQRIPVKLQAHTPDAVATLAGGEVERDWRRLSRRGAALRDRLGGSPSLDAAIGRHAETIRRLDDLEFTRVADVVGWLATRDVSGMRPRQLPIRGVDSKWFGANRALVTALHTAVTEAELSIVDADPLVRVRVLDEQLAHGGLLDFAAPVSQLGAVNYQPQIVFVFENLETVLAMPAWPGAIAVHGSGYAVDVVTRLEWVRRTPIVYWGDLDSNGFAILHRLRSSHDKVRSVLMDEPTLLAHHDLWVHEPSPKRGTFSTLTETEASALQRISDEGYVRLEQERIPWDVALKALRAAVL